MIRRSVWIPIALSACHLFEPKPGLEIILAVDSQDDADIRQTETTIRNRLERAGVRGSSVKARPDGKLRVLLPATSETERVTTLLTRRAQLEFRIVDEQGTLFRDLSLPSGSPVERGSDRRDDWKSGNVYEEHYLVASSRKELEAVLASVEVPTTVTILLGNDHNGRVRTYVVGKAELTGDFIESAEARLDEMTMAHNVFIHFDARGARMFEKLTEENVRRKLAIVLDDKVMSAPVIQERIRGGSAQITLGGGGRDPRENEAEARDLASILGAGALPATVTVESQTTLTP